MSVRLIKEILNRSEIEKPNYIDYRKDFVNSNVFILKPKSKEDLANFIHIMNTPNFSEDYSVYLPNKNISINYRYTITNIYRINSKYLDGINSKSGNVYFVLKQEDILRLVGDLSLFNNVNVDFSKKKENFIFPKELKNEYNRPLISEYLTHKIFEEKHLKNDRRSNFSKQYMKYYLDGLNIIDSNLYLKLKEKSSLYFFNQILIDDKDTINSVKRIFSDYDFNAIFLEVNTATTYYKKLKFYLYFCKFNENEEFYPPFTHITSSQDNNVILFNPFYFEIYKTIYNNYYDNSPLNTINDIIKINKKIEKIDSIFSDYIKEQGKKLFDIIKTQVINEIKQEEMGEEIIENYNDFVKEMDYFNKIETVMHY